MAEETGSAGGGDNLAFAAALRAVSVAFIQELEEGEDGIVHCAAVYMVSVGEVGNWRGPGVLDEVLQGVARLQLIEHGP